MASKYPKSSAVVGGDRIHPLDMVSYENEFVRTIPADRLVTTELLVAMFWDDTHYAVLYHGTVGKEKRTFMKGQWAELGLYDPTTEIECHELRGKSLIQGYFSNYYTAGVVYVLSEDGIVYSIGDDNNRLGRPTHTVASTKFGPVPIPEPIRAIACGGAHCIALAAKKVFAFGQSYYGQCGVPGVNPVKEPTEVYEGTGDNEPCDVNAGYDHSVILTKGGQVLTFGCDWDGRTGHDKQVDTPTPIKSLGVKIQQIGCTERATYFLAGGKMFGCGLNVDARLGSGDEIVEINTGEHAIESFRGSRTLVVALTRSRDILVWGKFRNNVKTKLPQVVEHLHFPRDLFSEGEASHTAGVVYPATQAQQQVKLIEEKLAK